MKNGELPINPLRGANNVPFLVEEMSHIKDRYLMGLTKREYFAGLAMQGLLASFANPSASGCLFKNNEFIPEEAIKYADELLKQLDK